MHNKGKLIIAAFVLVLLLAAVTPAYADPDVEEHYPKRNATNVPINVTIRVQFDDDMDEESVLEGFTLRDDEGEDVSGKVSYQSGSREAFFKPASPLKYNTRYRVRLSGSIENVDGDNLDYSGFYFTTVRDAAVYVDDVEIVGETISVNRSPVNITVYAPGAEKVLYNKEELEKSRNYYVLENVILKTGNNSFSFEVIYEYLDEDRKTQEGKFTVKKTVKFVNVQEEGASVVHDFNKSNKVSVFDKQLTIDFPKNYYLREKDGAAESQLMAFKLEKLFNVNGSPTVSYLFNIAYAPWTGDGYRFDVFQDYKSDIVAPAGGEMTVPLEDLSEAAFRTVTVLYDPYDGYNGQWENIGGQADAGKKTITVPFKGFGRYVAVNPLWNFRDTGGPARPYVEYLWAKGIMSPSPDALPGYFGLTDQNGRDLYVTKGEFTLMLGKALKLELPENYAGFGSFNDIMYASGYSYSINAAGQWTPLPRDAAPYIEAAVKNGFINGRRDKDDRFVFGYNDKLTREQAASSIMSAAGLAVNWSNDKAIRTQLARTFKDHQSISTLAGPYVLAAVQRGYLQRYEDWTFRPGEQLTRADAAMMIYKLMESKKLL